MKVLSMANAGTSLDDIKSCVDASSPIHKCDNLRQLNSVLFASLDKIN